MNNITNNHELTPPKKKARFADKDDVLFCSQESELPSTQDHNSAQTWYSWTVEELFDELCDKGFDDIAEVFREEEICGRNLPHLTEDRLKHLGIKKLGKILDFTQFKEDIGCVTLSGPVYHPNTKIFNDPIHGHIELHPLCVRVIDTPQFQRLRFLKQLGACYFVFPGAAHNRFEHSIGVCHLAGQLARTLQRRQPELGILEQDILCVEIAGLCHDLGHGPFSHLFDGEFIPRTCNGRKWKHEDASVEMFDFLVAENVLLPVFQEFGLGETDLIFIKEQIKGPLQPSKGRTEYPYQGRSREKRFLYEIVANKRNGIDVDKWDYFARDCHMLGLKNNFDHNRCMKFARVINVDGVVQICARDKEATTLYEMFHTRGYLHRQAYQHKVNKIIEAMITEAMLKANDHIKIPGRNGKLLKMSECIDDMVAYTKLTDHVLHQIMLSTEPELQRSRTIINNILCRRLYKCVGQSQPSSNKVISGSNIPKIRGQMIECMSEEDKESGVVLTEEDIVVHMVYLDYGMKEKNPMENVRFYNKDSPNKAAKLPKEAVSAMLPDSFAEQMILVYCKDLHQVEKLGIAARCFANWCDSNKMELLKDSPWLLTPVGKRRDSVPVTPENHPAAIETMCETPATAGKFKQRLSFDN